MLGRDRPDPLEVPGPMVDLEQRAHRHVHVHRDRVLCRQREQLECQLVQRQLGQPILLFR